MKSYSFRLLENFDLNVGFLIWFLHTMEYCLAMRKEDDLPSVTTGMDLEGFSKINQRKINTACYHLHLEYKNQKQIHRYSSYWRGEGRARKG